MNDNEQQAVKLKADYRQTVDQLKADTRFTTQAKLEQALTAHTEVTDKLRALSNGLAEQRRADLVTARRAFLSSGTPAGDTSVLAERDAADRAHSLGTDHMKVSDALVSALDRADSSLARALAVHAEDHGMPDLSDAWAEASGAASQSALSAYRRAVAAAGPRVDMGSLMTFSAPVPPNARDFPDGGVTPVSLFR